MKIFLVPQWLQKTLEVSKCDLETVTSVEKLLAIVSIDDVAFYTAGNLDRKTLLGDSFTSSFSAFDAGLDRLDGVQCEKLSSLIAIHTLNKETFAQRFWLGELNDTTQQFGLVVNFLNDEALCVTPYLLDEETSPTQATLTFYNRLIGLLNVKYDFEEVVKLPVFKHYLRLLQIT